MLEGLLKPLEGMAESMQAEILDTQEMKEKFAFAFEQDIDDDVLERLLARYESEKNASPMAENYLTFDEWVNYSMDLSTPEGNKAQDEIEDAENLEHDMAMGVKNKGIKYPKIKKSVGRPKKTSMVVDSTWKELINNKIDMSWFENDSETNKERSVSMNAETVVEKSEVVAGDSVVKRGRGRPRTKPEADPNAPKKQRGRPKGSKNKPKDDVAVPPVAE